jgi:hypothetical protein
MSDQNSGLRVHRPDGQVIGASEYIAYLEQNGNLDELRQNAIQLVREMDAYITKRIERDAWVIDQVREWEAYYRAELKQAQATSSTSAPVVRFEPGAIALHMAIDPGRRVITVTDSEGRTKSTATIERT